MKIIQLVKSDEDYIQQASKLLCLALPHGYKENAKEEVLDCLETEKILLGAVDEERLVGFVGAMPQYGRTAWELHPLAVHPAYQGKGIGTKLCQQLETVLKERGCLTLYLGTDDETGSTSLANTDLFEDTFEKINRIKNIHPHPYVFYQKLAYKILGVLPNANGIGKPDIWMGKSLVGGNGGETISLGNINQELTMKELMARSFQLWEQNKDKWSPMEPEHGKDFILYMIEEIGEVIAILKKKKVQGIMENPTVRARFIEEMTDVLMYYVDVLNRFKVTPEEFAKTYRDKSNHNMGRDYTGQYKKYLDEE